MSNQSTTTKNALSAPSAVSALSAPVLPVVSVAAFSADDRQAAILAHSDAVRSETLRRCYAIPSYEWLTATEKNAVYDRVRREAEADIFSSSAPWLTCNDCAFLIEEAGSDFLHDFISARFGFSAAYSAPEMWEGEDGNLYTLRDLVNDYNTMREDPETAAQMEEDEIESFDDFLDYETAMGGFLRELYTYYGFTVNGYDTGEYFCYIESAFDAAELFQRRGNMHKRIEIVRYVVSDNN